MAVTSPRGFSAGDAGATMRTWGFEDGDACHQYIGSVPVRKGLCLAFPNIYQHRQTSFHLLDSSKEGHQTVLSFLLVDPDIHPITSTSNVAPQQEEWIKRAVDQFIDMRLPSEIIEQIMADVEGVMTREEAKRMRTEMLEERKQFRKQNDSYHFCVPFDVWNATS
jgi:hypothetical protein